MEVFECKYCKSKNLMLESRVNGENVMTANMVALKCTDCGKWIKWCPKEDRHFYIKEKEKTFTFTQEQLDQHDIEIRADERNKWQDKFDELEKWANKKMYWTDDIQGTYTGNGYALCQEKLKQKLNELKEIK